MIKFQKYFVSNGTHKAKVWYSVDNRVDGSKAVTLYSKDYSHDLYKVFGDLYQNDTDAMTDYFERGRVVIGVDHPMHSVAYARAQQNLEEAKARYAARIAKSQGMAA